ncbi:hypothetical protein AX289_31485 [Methylorubrum populi]|nr:hypothetical protein AX289_31485 [Methylorubrum populi]
MAVAGLLRQERVTVGELFDRLGPEGLGLALLLLTLPTLIPVPGPIGITFGALIALVAIQVMIGAGALWLPQVLRSRTLPSAILRGVIARALPWLARAEHWLHERRLASLTGRRARAVVALLLLPLAVAIILPIPFGNVGPALALIAFSLGFMARDGAAILLAVILGLAALAWTGFLFMAGAALLEWGAALVGW